MTVKLAVFDCDGTLVDGQAAICETMEKAFIEAGMPAPERSHIRRIVGLSLPQAIRQLAPQAQEAQQIHAVDAYKKAFRATRLSGNLHEPLFPGMRELLLTLAKHEWTLGVATGKSDPGLHGCLDHHGIKGQFVTLQTADRHPSKPDPSMLKAALFEGAAQPENAVMIGDTTYDIVMAQAAGVAAIGVSWGYHEPQELLDAGAIAVADTMAELEALILER